MKRSESEGGGSALLLHFCLLTFRTNQVYCTIMIYCGLYSFSPLLSGGGLSVGNEVNQPPFRVGCLSPLPVSW